MGISVLDRDSIVAAVFAFVMFGLVVIVIVLFFTSVTVLVQDIVYSI